jgi:hypothetical protein
MEGGYECTVLEVMQNWEDRLFFLAFDSGELHSFWSLGALLACLLLDVVCRVGILVLRFGRVIKRCKAHLIP